MNGSDKIAIGFQALSNNISGNLNTTLGVNAGAKSSQHIMSSVLAPISQAPIHPILALSVAFGV